MKISGKDITAKIYENLQNRVGELKKRGVVPHLTVILVGDSPASIAYINQKQKMGEFIGAKITILKYPKSATTRQLSQKINALNNDPTNHAILIQRPLPPHLDPQKLERLVNPLKDIDGFHPDSPYTLPLPLAVIKILEEIYQLKKAQGVASVGVPVERPQGAKRLRTSDGENARQDPVGFIPWLQKQNIVILGKGPTGGGPIIKYLNKLGAHPTQIDSKTLSPDKLIKKADIIIPAIGKPNIITSKKIKKGAILIGVGIAKSEDGKLHGDYNEDNIKNTAGFYTPTPGGVGPVNVGLLMDNLITTTEKQSSTTPSPLRRGSG